jgi:hypothetical protein
MSEYEYMLWFIAGLDYKPYRASDIAKMIPWKSDTALEVLLEIHYDMPEALNVIYWPLCERIGMSYGPFDMPVEKCYMLLCPVCGDRHQVYPDECIIGFQKVGTDGA